MLLTTSMKIAITGVRDGLVVLGLALLLCVLLVGSFFVAVEYKINTLWVFFTWGSFAMVPFFVRAFRGHLRQGFTVPFLMLLAIIHGFVFMSLIKWHVPAVYWFPIFSIEFFLGFWLAYRFFGVIPSGDV